MVAHSHKYYSYIITISFLLMREGQSSIPAVAIQNIFFSSVPFHFFPSLLTSTFVVTNEDFSMTTFTSRRLPY